MRTAWFPVEFPSQDRIFYYLVYVTHHAKGIIVFLEESEKAFDYQRAVKFSVRQRQRETKSGMADLFGDALGNQARPSTTVDADLRTAWLRQLPSVGSELSVDESQMADLAEQCGCFISELREAVTMGKRTNGMIKISLGAGPMVDSSPHTRIDVVEKNLCYFHHVGAGRPLKPPKLYGLSISWTASVGPSRR